MSAALVAVLTSNIALPTMPSNVFLPTHTMGLSRDSGVNVTALVTLNKSDLSDHAGKIPVDLLTALSLTTSRRQP